MPARKPTDIVNLKLRFREELRRRLDKEAKKSGRSLNGEIVARLERSLEANEMRTAVSEAARFEIARLALSAVRTQTGIEKMLDEDRQLLDSKPVLRAQLVAVHKAIRETTSAEQLPAAIRKAIDEAARTVAAEHQESGGQKEAQEPARRDLPPKAS
jgi:DNA-binding FrmR family transcriptional regulator